MSPADVVPVAVPISLMQRFIVALIGLNRKPPAVRCPAVNAVTAVPPVVTVFTSKVIIVLAAGVEFVTLPVLVTTPFVVPEVVWSILTGQLAAPAAP